jgi:hypothetical protein
MLNLKLREMIMKNLIKSLFILVAGVFFTSAAFTADKPSQESYIPITTVSDTILGNIESMDMEKDVVLVKDQETNTVIPIRVKPEQLDNLQVGSFVKVILTHDNTLTASYIEIVKPDSGHRDRRTHHRRLE